ncbi:hypothetical protein [Egibacter rhizosphaerae]|nr:hypothetical protein [Egibacter rhizosphaerae]
MGQVQPVTAQMRDEERHWSDEAFQVTSDTIAVENETAVAESRCSTAKNH